MTDTQDSDECVKQIAKVMERAAGCGTTRMEEKRR